MKPLYTPPFPDFCGRSNESLRLCCLACAIMGAKIKGEWFINELLRLSKQVVDVHENNSQMQQLMLSKLSFHDRMSILQICKLLTSYHSATAGGPLVVHRRFYQREVLQLDAKTESGFFRNVQLKRGCIHQAFYTYLTLSYVESVVQELCHDCVRIQDKKASITKGLENVPLDDALKISFIRDKCQIQFTEATSTGGCDTKYCADVTHDEDMPALLRDIQTILRLHRTRRIFVVVLHFHSPCMANFDCVVKMETWINMLQQVYGGIGDFAIAALMEQSIFQATKAETLQRVNDGLDAAMILSDIIWDVVEMGVRKLRNDY